ncbi:MAG: Hsp70 family protein [Oxalobacteraceae bacterium]|nr:Hsp70 family protein [Oxalobacteraceae bacterium]
MKRFIVGIDLGTTNTVVAYTELAAQTGGAEIRLFDIEQLVAPGEIQASPLLPSVRYHAAPGELAAGELQLPWPQTKAGAETEVNTGNQNIVFGQLARKLGSQVPGRLVTSAKSWLSHAGVDRLAPILPWGADDGVGKVSPLTASASYLAYLRAAWNWRFPDQRLEQQELVLTVPASFDEGARALTVSAAREAGLPNLRLLEEPQAVFYDWLFRHRHTLNQELAHTRLVLVCDVGGGTTDLSLIKVDMQEGQPQLTRIAVGNHLMLGGDNMDLALAHLAETRLAQSTPGQAAARLSAGKLSQLMERCRAAKEVLLAAQAPEQAPVTLLGGGAKLIGGARSIDLSRDEVERIIVDGFFPKVAPDQPAKRSRGGIVEFGLPYASDPAITRHVAGFLRQHAAAVREALGDHAGAPDQLALPDTLLLNGGVFRADALVRRLQDTLQSWRGAALQLLHNDNPDLAVARGAVAYALAGQGRAPRIGGGAPRSYFLVLDEDGKQQRQPDGTASRRAVCVLPRGSEPGEEILLHQRTFALRVGRPVRFHLLSSIAEAGNQPAPKAGELIDLAQGNFVRLPPVAMVLQAGSGTRQQEIPVQLATALTELGTLEMHCVEATENRDHPGQRWLLEFQLRGAHSGSGAEITEENPLPPRIKEAIEKIERIFGSRAQQVTPKEVRQLRLHLEQLLGSRERWQTPLLRQLFDALLPRARGRRRSAEHERAWLNLAGFCLRPGFGAPLDDWRIAQLWPLFEQGVQHGKDSQVCAEWWTLWRRVAGGLDAQAQLRLLDDFAFNLQADEAKTGPRPANLVRGSHDDMLRLGASLERIPPDYKVEIGSWLLDNIRKPDQSGIQARRNLWALARVGARQPCYGNTHDVVPPDIVAGWLEMVLTLDWKRVEPAAFAAAHMARMTGDRMRDLPIPLREQIIWQLRDSDAAPSWIAMVGQIVQLDEADERRMLGESLPPGLKLIA